jgi:predicted dehydrogenase
MALLKFTNGSMASLWTGVDVIRPGFPGSTYRSFISGDLGLLDVDGYGAVQACYDKQNWETLYVQPAVDWQGEGKFAINRMASFNAQNQDFIDCIVNNTRPPVSGVDGEISVHIVEQIYQAARENRTIRFQEN